MRRFATAEAFGSVIVRANTEGSARRLPGGVDAKADTVAMKQVRALWNDVILYVALGGGPRGAGGGDHGSRERLIPSQSTRSSDGRAGISPARPFAFPRPPPTRRRGTGV